MDMMKKMIIVVVVSVVIAFTGGYRWGVMASEKRMDTKAEAKIAELSKELEQLIKAQEQDKKANDNWKRAIDGMDEFTKPTGKGHTIDINSTKGPAKQK